MQKDTNEIWGTPYYIAPEKVKKEPVDYRADMYSLGGTIYHALTGVAPFEGDDAAAVVRKRFEGAPVPPSKLRPDISPQIDALVLKMLALNPSDRFPSFEALLQEYSRVMATGLTAAPAGAAAPTGTSVGGRKIMMKGRKRFKVKTAVEGAEGGEGDQAEQSTSRHSAPPQEQEEGGVAGKVLAVIGITIAAIGLVAGLLVWYVIADRNSRERAKQEQIAGNLHKAREAIADIRRNALKFAEEFDILAGKAVAECQRPTDQLRRELSEKFDSDIVARIKPGPTPELLEAIALTNVVEKASEGDTNALAAAGAQMAQAADGATQGQASNTTAVVSAAANAAAPAVQQEPAAPAATSAESVTSAADAKFNEALQSAIRNMNELWGRAYSCQAAAIRLHHNIDLLVEKIDSTKIEGDDEAAMQRAAEFSQAAKDEFDQIKASDDVSKVQKAVGYIRSKGSQTVKQTTDRLLIIKKELERAEESERKKKEEEERLARLEKEKQETIAADNEKIKEKFESLVTAGVFRQLDWKGAIRQLTMVKDEFKFSESQVYADIYIHKVKMMATVQEVFIANCKDYKFAKSKLARFKISNISEKEISLIKPDGKTPVKMTWVKFYQHYHGNLNELIIKFIEKGKNVCRLSDGKRLSLQPWADAMMGAALTMQIICGDDPTVTKRAEQIAKNAVKELPEYLNRAKAIFPDMQFDAVPEE